MRRRSWTARRRRRLADLLAEINVALGAPAEAEPGKEKEKAKSHV